MLEQAWKGSLNRQSDLHVLLLWIQRTSELSKTYSKTLASLKFGFVVDYCASLATCTQHTRVVLYATRGPASE